ncbi:hypothetical protein MNBD_GAMMA04-1497 [hydrothermal vent metagenome]|uniref:Uncharacterized protein n=1 Tax=hydrothermal vent metagenome TaxID=652676 RepID=A0A3B0W759_9ZZZZ
MGHDNSVNIEVIDFVLDEKRIKRHSFEQESQIDTHFNFDLLSQPKDSPEINAVFRVNLSIEYIKEKDDGEEKKILAEAFVILQFATFITNISSVNLKEPSEEQVAIARSIFYPIARSLISNELNLIQRDYSDIPYSI